MYQKTFRAVNYWYQNARVSKASRTAEYKKIAATASELAKMLRKYELGRETDFCFEALIGTSHREKMLQILHPEALKRESLRDCVNHLYAMVLPTIPEMLKRLSNTASENSTDARPAPVRKINAKTAFRTYLIEVLGKCLNDMGAYSHATVAACACAGLDDPNITPDLVRKILDKMNS